MSTFARLFANVVVNGDADRDVVVCVRDKQRGAAEVGELCRALQAVLRPSNVGVAVHTHVELVGALGLCGAHLPSTATAAQLHEARAALPADATLGVSAHPRSVGDRCAIDDVDYATWSPVFSPSSKQDARAPIGLSALCGHHTPVLALGGVDSTNAAACLAAGAVGVAVIGAVLGAAAPHHALTSLLMSCSVPFAVRRRTPEAA